LIVIQHSVLIFTSASGRILSLSAPRSEFQVLPPSTRNSELHFCADLEVVTLGLLLGYLLYGLMKQLYNPDVDRRTADRFSRQLFYLQGLGLDHELEFEHQSSNPPFPALGASHPTHALHVPTALPLVLSATRTSLYVGFLPSQLELHRGTAPS